jgi:hypothetical protein
MLASGFWDWLKFRPFQSILCRCAGRRCRCALPIVPGAKHYYHHHHKHHMMMGTNGPSGPSLDGGGTDKSRVGACGVSRKAPD